MADPFKDHSQSLTSPGFDFYEITPHDTAEIDPRPRAIRVNLGGDIVAVNAAGDEVAFTLVSGEVLDIRFRRIKATGTTASGIVGII